VFQDDFSFMFQIFVPATLTSDLELLPHMPLIKCISANKALMKQSLYAKNNWVKLMQLLWSSITDNFLVT